MTSSVVVLSVEFGRLLILSEVLAVQLRASLTVTLCRIALNPLKVVGDVATANAPPSRSEERRVGKQRKFTVIAPPLEPWKLTSSVVAMSVSNGGILLQWSVI